MNLYPTKKSFTRRRFVKHSAVAFTGINAMGFLSCSGSKKTKKTIRLITYNVLKCTGWPAENVINMDLIPELIVQELLAYKPDIISFSESPKEPLVKRIAHSLNMNYIFFESAGDWPGAIFTHFEILDSVNVPIVSGDRPEDLFTRHWGRATIELSSGKSIVVNSVHLFPHDNPVSGEIRSREITYIINSVEEEINGKPIIVMGDLNHTPELPEYMQWLSSGFIDTFTEAGSGSGLTIRADNPTRRIDYILTHGIKSEDIVNSQALFTGAFRTNDKDSSSYALSDHIPHYAEIRM